ncbi:MAG: hypothetical protein RMZ41_009595 [Nostoc sp. DedVER02]|uniref:hypothetical protein n=1 Tax=unclassified Nostoc TaxID=2593658 RepID=UPI002AD5A7AD|nr:MULTISPECIES: hypothetical protein [unclassified Nostoc]MDZ7985640.1 hypothetical protein [Nostoc sp. DedVER02]MDZ8111296.1 hypothetical protein [Nostoc sp. DedVER01b]
MDEVFPTCAYTVAQEAEKKERISGIIYAIYQHNSDNTKTVVETAIYRVSDLSRLSRKPQIFTSSDSENWIKITRQNKSDSFAFHKHVGKIYICTSSLREKTNK